MSGLRVGLASTVGLLLLAILPAAGAGAPVSGTVAACSSNWSCDFTFNTSVGHGWANGTSGGFANAGSITLKLPGETLTSTGPTYWTAVPKVSTAWPNSTYWTTGNFIGTDVNTGKVVYGTTSSNFTAYCHVVYRWCHYTYTTNNGTIEVKFTLAEMTSTTLSCTPSTIKVASKTTCTATVTNLWNSSNYPTGKLHFSNSALGKFSNRASCTLSANGTCSFTWHPSDNTCGSVTLSATYGGTTYYYKSSGATTVGVIGGC
jgi:hypothetical protein